MELIRTYKLLALIIVFLMVGIISPVTSYFMEDLLNSVASDLVIINYEFTYIESWVQFTSNVGQLCNIVFVFIFFDFINRELENGQLTIPFSKGLSKIKLLTSKIVVAVGLYISLLIVAYLVCTIYILVLYGEFDLLYSLQILLSNIMYGIFLIGLISLANVIVHRRWITLIVIAGLVFIPSIIFQFINLPFVNILEINSFNIKNLFDTGIAPYGGLDYLIFAVQIACIYALSYIFISKKQIK